MEKCRGSIGMDRGYAKRKLLKKDTQKAAVFGAVLICAAAFTAALTGCVSTQAETEKIRDMKYEVIEEEDIPQSLREMIKGGEKKPFRITYSDQGFLYIAQGYEVQPTTGYSVEVKELYETETAVWMRFPTPSKKAADGISRCSPTRSTRWRQAPPATPWPMWA